MRYYWSNPKFQGAAALTNTPAKKEIFSLDTEENAGIAALCRGFLRKSNGKRASLRESLVKQRLLIRKSQLVAASVLHS